MAVTRRLRYEILRRDNHTCRYCGQGAPDVKLTVDHVTPVALGGKDEAANLVTACQPCNAGKTSSAPDAPLVDDVAADALRWAQARTATINEWRQKRRALAADLEDFRQAWDDWGIGEGDERRPVPRDGDWANAMERWLDEGFLVEDLIELIPKAMHNKPTRTGRTIQPDDRWRYYCAVVWRTLDDIQAATTAQVDGDEEQAAEEQAGKDYSDGFEDGRAYERAEVARQEALKAQFGIEPFRNEPPPEPRTCIKCGVNQEYGTTRICMPCFTDPEVTT